MITYLDASAVIYATEDTAIGKALRNHLNASDGTLAVSPLVRLESLIRPMRTHDNQMIQRRLTLLEACKSLRIDDATFELATHVRATHKLSTADAIHLATAGQHQCDRMITGDKTILRSAPDFAVDVAGLS